MCRIEKSAKCDRTKHWAMRPPKSTAKHQDAVEINIEKLDTCYRGSFCLPLEGRVALFIDVLGSGTLQVAAFLRTVQGMLNVPGAGSVQSFSS